MTLHQTDQWELEQRAICHRKRAYLSQSLAINAAWIYQLIYGDPSTPYVCPYCSDWHLTTHPKETSDG